MKVGISKNFVRTNPWDIETVRFKAGEVGRLCVLDAVEAYGLEMIHVHYVNYGQNAQGKGGTFGRYFCLGDYNKIFGTPEHPGSGSDPEACPFCGVAIRNGPIQPVTPQYIGNVVKYMTDSKGEIRLFGNQFGFDILPWRFGGGVYERLVELQDQSKTPLENLDLRIVCENQDFQKLKIDAYQPTETLWRKSQEVATLVVGQFKTQRRSDLVDLVGTRVTKEQAERMVQEATGSPMPRTNGGIQAPMTNASDVQKLLDSSSNAAVAANPFSQTTGAIPQPATAAPQPVHHAGNPPSAPVAKPTINFDDLLKV